jgi:HAD superfamily hydrolase (TIGR01509 family)
VIQALVFDFDGLILDTESPALTAWCEVFADLGCPPPTAADLAAVIGTAGTADLFDLLIARAAPADDVDLDAVQAKRRARRDELLDREQVRPGVTEWLADAQALGIPIAIASSSPEEWVHHHLERLGLRERFAAIRCSSDSLAAKPAPDTYLAACEALDVIPTLALAIEDSPHGVSAARRAGLRCIAVPNSVTEGLDLSHADLVLTSLADAHLADFVPRG